MPGVVVDLDVLDGPPTAAAPETGQYMPVGLAERGPTTGYATVRSMAEYDEQFGGDTAYGFLRKDLRRFFRRGGSLAHVARVVGPAATKATVTLQDKAGSPVNTLRIDAANAGVWGSQHLQVQPLAGSTGGTYRLQVSYDGVVVEDKDNLLTPADAVAAFAGSFYVTATDLASVTAAPNNQPKALGAPVSLTGGSDDRASVTTPMLGAALGRFPADLGAGAMAIPGYPADLVGPYLKAATDNNTTRVGGCQPAKGTTKAQAQTLAATLEGEDGSGLIMLWPYVQADGAGTPLVSSEGIWAGLRAAQHRRVGPWGVPAADEGEVGFITGLEFEATEAEANDLDASKVSVWRKMRRNGGYVFQLYGYRSLSTDLEHFALLSTRDLLNYLQVQLQEDFAGTVYKGVDSRGVRAGEAQARVAARLDPLVDAGVLFDLIDQRTGAVIGPPYRVDAGPSVNTATVLGRQEFDVYVGVRPSPVSALVRIRIATAGLLAAV